MCHLVTTAAYVTHLRLPLSDGGTDRSCRLRAVLFYDAMHTIQVRFVHELLCALQPGTPLMALHGKVCESLFSNSNRTISGTVCSCKERSLLQALCY
jgi:hypothetical protein